MRLSRRCLLGKVSLVGAAAAMCTPLGLVTENTAPTVENTTGPVSAGLVYTIATIAADGSWSYDTTLWHTIGSVNDVGSRIITSRVLPNGAVETTTRLGRY